MVLSVMEVSATLGPTKILICKADSDEAELRTSPEYGISKADVQSTYNLKGKRLA